MTTPTTLPQLNLESAPAELRRLGCYGLAAQAETLLAEPWLARVIEIEAAERARLKPTDPTRRARWTQSASAGGM